MNFNAWLYKLIFKDKIPQNKTIGYLEAIVSIIGNILLFLIKLFFGIVFRSIALIAEGFHSLSDVLTSIVVLFGFKIGSKPADKEHPFGHGRVEHIATLIIAILLVITAYDLGKASIVRIIKPEVSKINYWVLLVMTLSGIFKEWMARFSVYLGKKINSSSLIADAWHHRSDAIASFLVGFGLIFVNFGFYFVDGVLGVLVSFLLLWIAINLTKSSSSFLIGEAPDSECIEKIKQAVFSTKGVLDYHDLRFHDYQDHKVVSLHIEVLPELTAKEAHNIALKVQDKIKEEIKSPSDITVHIDPKGERED